MMRDNTVYITDLDGTLLNSDSKVSQKSIEIINSLIEDGMNFTYATARSLISAKKVTQGLNLKLPVVVYNGGFIIDIKDNSILDSNFFNTDESEFIESILKEHNIYPLVYSYIDNIERVSWHINHLNEGINYYVKNRAIDDPRLNPVNNIEDLYSGKKFYYTCIGEKDELEFIYKFFKDDNRFYTTLKQELYRPEYWLEIAPINSTKANGIIKLKSLLDIENLVVFGDEINDMPMFEIADKSYAVENGLDELKNIATEIIGNHNDDSVALWLKNNFKR